MIHLAQDLSTLDESTRTLKAFADPVRLRLLNLLGGEWDEVCVCHLFEALGAPQPTVSRHLAYLRKHGLVVGRKDGLWVHYRLAKPGTGLQRILLGCLGSCLGDPLVFREDQQRLSRIISKREGGGSSSCQVQLNPHPRM